MKQYVEYGAASLQLMRLHKPVGIWLLLWPILWTLWIVQNGSPDTYVLSIFIAGTVIMRSFGCIINDMLDRDFDVQVARTKNRPLANGTLSMRTALYLSIVLLLLAAVLVIMLGRTMLFHSVIALCLASLYPLAKRYVACPQLILGLAFSYAVIMAAVASVGHVSLVVWLIFASNIIWILIYDTYYAMADMEDDVKININSAAIWLGKYALIAIASWQCIFIALWISIAALLEFSIYFYTTLCAVALLFVYQQFLAKDRASNKCLQAFLTNQWLGAILFLGIYLQYSLK